MLVKPHDVETLCITCSAEGVFLNGVSNFLRTLLTLVLSSVSVNAGMCPGLILMTTENVILLCRIEADPLAMSLPGKSKIG